MSDDEIRTSVLCQTREPVCHSRIDGRDLRAVLISYLQQSPKFVPHPSAEIKNVRLSPVQQFVFVWTPFTLFQALRELGLTEKDQGKLWNLMDNLSRKREIKIIHIGLDRNLSHLDVAIHVEIGKGIRTVADTIGWRTTRIDYYWDHPLSKEDFERGNPPVVNPSATVAALRKAQDERLRARFGGWSREAEIEKELRAIDREARLELSRKLSAIIGEVKINEK